MAIKNPDHRFRLVMRVYAGPSLGEKNFYSAAQRNLLEVIQLVQAMGATVIKHEVRSWVIQEEELAKSEFGNPRWHELDYSDWGDLAWPKSNS